MKRLNVFISGQKYFGQEIFRLCNSLDFINIVGVCAPVGDKYLGAIAAKFNVPIIPAGSLNHETLPDRIDLGITAHSFDYIGRLTRYKTVLGWIGYHPSLLPRHRGRSAIEWAIRMKEHITGGTVFWLNSGIDRGDIACQDWCFIDPKLFIIDPKKAARILWESRLMDMGVELMETALIDISRGIIIKQPQDNRFSTFEPNTDIKDIYKPDLLMIEMYGSEST